MIDFLGLTHVLLGITVYSLFFEFNFISVVSIILGSLFPDIDTPSSKLGKYNIFAYSMKHRGFTHTILGLTLFTIMIYALIGSRIVYFALGYLLHLLADTMTPMGVMWLYPFNKKCFTLSTKGNNPRDYEGLIILLCIVWIFLGNGKGAIKYKP